MEAVGLKENDKPATMDLGITLGSLAELTGFPVDYIKRELLLENEVNLDVVELREKVLTYLNSI